MKTYKTYKNLNNVLNHSFYIILQLFSIDEINNILDMVANQQ